MFKILVSVCILIVLSGCQYLTKVDEAIEKPVPQIEVEVETETEEIETSPTETGVVKREEITEQLTNQELLQLNKYFSHLQNGYFLSYDSKSPDYEALLELGFWLFVFDYNDAQVNNLEMDGTSYNVYEYNDFNDKINEYFDVQLPKETVGNWLFIDNCYYYPHLGMGYSLNTVIQTERIFDNGDESFFFEGSVHQFESGMGDDHYDQYLQPKSTWSSSMESQLIGTVTATIVYSERLNQYVIENYETTLVYTNDDGMDYPETNDLMSEETQTITEQEFKNEYINKLNSIEEGMSDLDYLYENGITVELIEAEETKLKRWDDMLNEIYSLLKIQLTESEMKELKSKQLSWIEYRDTTANNEASEEGGGSLSTVVYYSSLARLTKERCYELVNTYME